MPSLSGLILSPDLFPLHLVVVFVFGATMGSFFNVCIYRLPLGQSVNRPNRSFCPACGTIIAWYDNIPLTSYATLGGLCRYCGARISPRYWAVEFLTALLFAAVFWVHNYSLATPMFLFLTAILIISTFTDLDHWIIPDSISLGGTAVGIVGAAAISVVRATGQSPNFGSSLCVSFPFGQMSTWGVAANALAGAVFGYLLLWMVGVIGTLVFRKEAMGMGDMKLFACIGAFLGWQGCLMVLALGSFVGATFGLSLIAAQWIVAKTCPRASSAASRGADRPTNESLLAVLAKDTALPPEAENRLRGRSNRRPLHHLPFGPYIAIAGYLVALFYRPMTDWLMRHVFFLNLFGGR